MLNPLTMLWRKLVTERINALKMRLAFRWIEERGLHVCNIVTHGNTHYLVDGKGGLHKIGKRT